MERQPNFNKYIGIPYKPAGRDVTGIDCYGLVRLVQKEQFGIDLPSFDTEYDGNDEARLEELIKQYKEGWEQIDKPEAGSVVLFSVLGYESHIGIAVDSESFLHVRENMDSVIEPFSTSRWNKRIVGHFKYSEKAAANLTAIPHPLKTETYTIPVPVGTTVAKLVDSISKEFEVAPELKSRIYIAINGVPIKQEDWETKVIGKDDVITYRTLPGKGAARMIAIVALAIIAPQIAVTMLGTATGATIAAAIGGTPYFLAAATTAVTMAGIALIDKIAPIRPPAEPTDPGSSERQLMVNGGQNQANPYGAIPVVLGKVRMTAQLASRNYLTFENERDSYLSMLLYWGHGPLHIDESTYKFGEVPVANFDNKTIITLDRKVEPTTTQLEQFDAIYGKDVDQVVTNQELVCDGNPEVGGGGASTLSSVYDSALNQTIVGRSFSREQVIWDQAFEAIFTVTGGASTWTDSCLRVADLVRTNLSATQIRLTGRLQPGSRFTGPAVVTLTKAGNNTATAQITLTGVAPGPWAEASTTQTTDSVGISLHFPQGLRRIVTEGGGAGSSQGANCVISIQRSSDGVNWFDVDTFNAAPTVDRQITEPAGWVWNPTGGDEGNGRMEPISQTITIQEPVPKKDAFTITKSYNRFTDNLDSNAFKYIRVRRETGDNTEDNSSYRYYHQVILHNVAFTTNTKPAIDPPNCKIAKTAIKIKASDQLNGSVEGANAIVQTIAPIWNGSNWNTQAPTSNPASLMIYVLTHPANPRRKTLNNIDQANLAHFYNYCQTKGFEYNAVLGSQRGLLEVIRDICAAGRGSPALKDGKWSVTIDEPKSQIVQMFTPHNSWGFEGVKNLPDIPHGLKIRFYNEEKGYQEDELPVFNIGYGYHNASLFESITLPGVTKASLVADHGKWHMAQAKLRPEVYSFNADIEYIVANRGDRIKVMHDVPMWGLGSGRIKNRISSTVLELDEPVPMEAGKNYILRIRSKTGSMITRNIVAATADGYYDEVTLTASATQAEADALDLFMFGENQQEGQDLLIIAVEPTSSKSARLTCVDYGVTDTYNIFTDYLTLTENVVFESQITLPGKIQINAFGDKLPTITNFLSDESVMDIVSKGVFRYNINIAYVNAFNLPANTIAVQAEYDISTATDNTNTKVVQVDYVKGSLNIPDVIEGETYKVRLRYVSNDGRTSQWTAYQNHTVVGKRSQPAGVSAFTATPEYATGQLKLSWQPNQEPDIKGYEVRSNTSFGNNTGLVFIGEATECFAAASAAPGQAVTYYICAYDYFGNYSKTVTELTWTYPAIQNVGSVTASFEDTALTAATVTLDWLQPDTTFAVDYYEVQYDSIVKQVKADVITLPANWLGNRSFSIKVVDINGNISTGATTNVTKLAPNSPTNYRSQVIDNTVMLFWKLPDKTTLPIDHTLLKKGSTWETAAVIGQKSGEFTTVDELESGNFTYWIAVVDTDGNTSTPVSLTTQVSEPPNFEFFGDFNANFNNGTKVNAVVENGAVVMPVKTSETWEQHFTTNSWTTPQNQISAGYPIYVQPANTTGYYEEVFDYGTILASSKITLNYTGTSFGNVDLVASIAISADGVNYTTYSGVVNVFATNFRYVKVRITANSNPNTELYRLESIEVRLDAKKKNDSLTVTALSSDASGTIVNFTKEFIDVQSINMTPKGTTPLTVVYDFQDAVLSATYAISSNICTVSFNNHGFIAGQKVRLAFSSGTGVNGTYVITTASTNSFTVELTAANSSGACLVYPESCRVYVYNTSGTRVTADVSVAITGY